MKKGAWVLGISLMMIISTSITPMSFAAPVETVEWQLVFITDNRACSNYDIQMTNTYHEVVREYMKAYKLDNTSAKPLCMTQYKFEDFESAPTVDLLIMVYGKDVGKEFLNRYLIGGIYYHPGGDISKNHVIIMCDCPNFHYSDPVWTLSHELSHFILYYRGFGPDVVEERIHKVDVQYDTCIDTRTAKNCEDIKFPLWIESKAYSYQVIPPILTGLEDYKKSKIVSVDELKRQITKLWTNNAIADSDYVMLMGYDVNLKNIRDSNGYFDKSKKFFTDGSKATKSNFERHNAENHLTDNQMSIILSKVPKSITSGDYEVIEVKIPHWFKMTSNAWIDKKISNDEYYTSLDYVMKKISRNDIDTSKN